MNNERDGLRTSKDNAARVKASVTLNEYRAK